MGLGQCFFPAAAPLAFRECALARKFSSQVRRSGENCPRQMIYLRCDCDCLYCSCQKRRAALLGRRRRREGCVSLVLLIFVHRHHSSCLLLQMQKHLSTVDDVQQKILVCNQLARGSRSVIHPKKRSYYTDHASQISMENAFASTGPLPSLRQ